MPKKTIVTHSGSFHPDDVFCVALLSIIYKGNIKVIRSRDKNKLLGADFIVDTGSEYNPDKNQFDHHQEGNAGFRDNKIPYSSFGLLWKKYGEEVCGSKKVADILDKKLVQVIDADDAGIMLFKTTPADVNPFVLTDAIYAFIPTWKEGNSNIDDSFLLAVDFARKVLLREITLAKDRDEAESLVEGVYKKTEDKRVIIFDKDSLPKSLLCKYPEPIFVVYPDRDPQKWRVFTIRKDEKGFEPRKNFPKSWWGKADGDLAKVTGISDAMFCRNGGIYAGVVSKEGAIKLAELALAEKSLDKNSRQVI